MELICDVASEIIAKKQIKNFKTLEYRGLYGIVRKDVMITSEETALLIGKPKGIYVNIIAEDIKEKTPKAIEYLSVVIAKAIKDVVKTVGLKPKAKCLVVGLGNDQITADSLGVKTIKKIIVSRNKNIDGLNEVCAYSCGVSGVTGIAGQEAVKGIVGVIKPDFVICIDSLCSGCVGRIGTSYQISDTGIIPGSGVGKRRFCIDKKSIGVPVVSVGVPTVVNLLTVVSEILEETSKEKRELYQNMVVTPYDVDFIVEECSYVVALAINYALNPHVGIKTIKRFMGIIENKII